MQNVLRVLKKLNMALFMFLLVLPLSGCDFVILQPKGMIALAEKKLLIDSVLLMCLIVVPVLILTAVIAWRYRASNESADYKPKWSHSYIIEAVIWTLPVMIILVLGIMTWKSTHKLDPYRPIIISGKKPVIIQAIALDWKWLFVYPEQKIAALNVVAFPANTPIEFQVTADAAPMNSFSIPRLAGQIYAMAGMRTKQYLVADEVGTYNGLSTNYSGNGFAGMKFKAHAMTQQQFNQWVQKARQSPLNLDKKTYAKLLKRTISPSPKLYASVSDPNLFEDEIMKYMLPASHRRDKLLYGN